jgi:hypothetical protein
MFWRRACFRKFASESDRSHRIKIRRFSLLVSTVCTFFGFAADTLLERIQYLAMYSAEMNVCDAPESNKTDAGAELTRNIPNTTS